MRVLVFVLSSCGREIQGAIMGYSRRDAKPKSGGAGFVHHAGC
jgi:hypothetical protein